MSETTNSPDAQKMQQISEKLEDLAETAAKLGNEKSYSHVIGQYDEEGNKKKQEYQNSQQSEGQSHIGTGANNPTTHFVDKTEKINTSGSHNKTQSSGRFSGINGGTNAITGGTADLSYTNFKNSATNDTNKMFSEKTDTQRSTQNTVSSSASAQTKPVTVGDKSVTAKIKTNSTSHATPKHMAENKSTVTPHKKSNTIKNNISISNVDDNESNKTDDNFSIQHSSISTVYVSKRLGKSSNNSANLKQGTPKIKTRATTSDNTKIRVSSVGSLKTAHFSVKEAVRADNKFTTNHFRTANISKELGKRAFTKDSDNSANLKRGIFRTKNSDTTSDNNTKIPGLSVGLAKTGHFPAKEAVRADTKFGASHSRTAYVSKELGKSAFTKDSNNSVNLKKGISKIKINAIFPNNTKIRVASTPIKRRHSEDTSDSVVESAPASETIAKTNTVKKQLDMETGAHNAMHINLETAGQGLLDFARSTYDNTDYTAGKQETKKYTSLLGMAEIAKITAKANVKDSIYRNITDEQLKKIRAITKNEKYRGRDNRSTNALKDYDSNMEDIDRALDKLGISGRSYNMDDVRKALNSGYAGSKKTGVRVTDGSDAYILLTEKKRLLKEKGKVSQARGSSGIKNVGKNWIKNAAQDTDTYQGYQLTKAAYTGVKAVGWGAKAIGGAVANTAITGAKWGAKASIKASELSYKRKFTVGYNGKRIPWKNTEAAKKFKVQQKKVNEMAASAKNRVHKFTTTSARDKAKFIGKKLLDKTGLSGVYSRFMNTRIMKKLNAFRIKAGNITGKLLKPLKAPFKMFNFFTRIIKKAAIGLCIFILLAGVAAAIICGISSILPSGFLDKSNKTDTYIGQDTIDYIYRKQIALHDYLSTGNWDKETFGKLPDNWADERKKIEEAIADSSSDENSEIVISIVPMFPSGKDPLNNESYNAGLIQKAIVSCITEALENEKDNYDIYKSFADDLLVGIYGNTLVGWGDFITFSSTGTDSEGHMTINVHYNYSYNYIKEVAKKTCSDSRYEKYISDNNNDGRHDENDFDGEWADTLYSLSDDDWYDIAQVEFHSFSTGTYTDSEIKNIINQINDNYKNRFHKNKDLASSRMKFISASLSCVGRATYLYGGGTPSSYPITDINQLPSTCDCSHFVCFALALGNVESYSYRTASNFCDKPMSNVGHDMTKLYPGTIISAEKTNGHGTNAHVIIYIGEADLGDGNGKRPLTVECTNASGYGGPNGIQVSMASRLGVHNNYGWYYEPNFKSGWYYDPSK